MKTTVIGSDKAKTNNEVKTNIRPNITGKEKNENDKSDAAKAPAETPQEETAQGTEVKAGDAPAYVNQVNQPAQATEAVKPEPQEQPQAEPSKKELKEQLLAKRVFNLDTTVKMVADLSKKIAQRDRLKNTIANLDTFAIQANEDGDVTESNKFHRCELTITDDEGNEFVTKNAYIIDHVAQYVNSLCVEKLAEIEAEIVIPA